MNKYVKALVAGAFMLAVAGSAGAHGKKRHHAHGQAYYPIVVQQHYVPVPAYYDDQFVQVRPEWEAQREWRREQWRHDQWRHDQWRRDQWRHDQWRRDEWRHAHGRHAHWHHDGRGSYRCRQHHADRW